MVDALSCLFLNQGSQDLQGTLDTVTQSWLCADVSLPRSFVLSSLPIAFFYADNVPSHITLARYTQHVQTLEPQYTFD